MLSKGCPDPQQWEAVATGQLAGAYSALTETIDVLQQTKSLFKSKQLANLRRKLQGVVDDGAVREDRPDG